MAWTYTQLFNTLNTADLNGQDSWSDASGAYDVVTTPLYEGAKAVQGVNANANATRSISSVSSGTVYFAMRMSTHGAGAGDAALDFRTGGNNRIRVQFRGDSGNVSVTNGAGSSTLITSFDSSIFYLFELTFDNSNGHSIRYHDGIVWSTALTGLTGATSGDIDELQLNSGSNQTIHYDTITPTNPIATSASSSPSSSVSSSPSTSVSSSASSSVSSSPSSSVSSSASTSPSASPSPDNWDFQDKNTTTYSNQGKNTTSYNNQGKSTTNWAYRGKN